MEIDPTELIIILLIVIFFSVGWISKLARELINGMIAIKDGLPGTENVQPYNPEA